MTSIGRDLTKAKRHRKGKGNPRFLDEAITCFLAFLFFIDLDLVSTLPFTLILL